MLSSSRPASTRTLQDARTTHRNMSCTRSGPRQFARQKLLTEKVCLYACPPPPRLELEVQCLTPCSSVYLPYSTSDLSSPLEPSRDPGKFYLLSKSASNYPISTTRHVLVTRQIIHYLSAGLRPSSADTPWPLSIYRRRKWNRKTWVRFKST